MRGTLARILGAHVALVGVGLLVAGCPGPTGAARPGVAATCEDAGANLSENFVVARRQMSAPTTAAEKAEYRDIAAGACRRDGWSAEVIACFASAPNEGVAEPGQGPINACAKKMTDEQRDSFVEAFRQAR